MLNKGFKVSLRKRGNFIPGDFINYSCSLCNIIIFSSNIIIKSNTPSFMHFFLQAVIAKMTNMKMKIEPCMHKSENHRPSLVMAGVIARHLAQ